MKALCLALGAVFAAAQSPAALEIRGTVIESRLGVAGATVTLYEFGAEPENATTRTIFATTSTDPKGEFAFHPARTGEYYVEVTKEGYFAESFDGPTADPIDTIGDPVSLDKNHSSQELRFSLVRLGELRGRVIDEDGMPLANLRVGLLPGTSTPVVTDADGYFAAIELRPGTYVVRIGPERGSPEIMSQFSEDDLKMVDRDFETSRSPGVPVQVSLGASLSVGTITARKATYYRAHLSVPSADCAPDENWLLTIRTDDTPKYGPTRQVPCGKEFLVRNLVPGLHSFILSTDERRGTEKRWAVTAVEVTDRNVEVAMVLAPGAEISGRLVPADGAKLPEKTTVVVTPLRSGWGFVARVSDQVAMFQVLSLPGDASRVSAGDMGDPFYVKEIRYGGLPVTDSVITPVAGPAILEIVIDDKAASISGSVADRDKMPGPIMIAAVSWPLSSPDTLLPILLGISAKSTADDQGKFRIAGLAPGEYRICALTEAMLIRNADNLVPLLNGAEKVTLERGGSQSVTLKIAQP